MLENILYTTNDYGKGTYEKIANKTVTNCLSKIVYAIDQIIITISYRCGDLVALG